MDSSRDDGMHVIMVGEKRPQLASLPHCEKSTQQELAKNEKRGFYTRVRTDKILKFIFQVVFLMLHIINVYFL